MSYCTYIWEHHSGHAICDCRNKAVKGTNRCKEHARSMTPREYISQLETALRAIARLAVKTPIKSATSTRLENIRTIAVGALCEEADEPSP